MKAAMRPEGQRSLAHCDYTTLATLLPPVTADLLALAVVLLCGGAV